MTDLSKYRKTLKAIQQLEPHEQVQQQAMQLSTSEHLDALRTWQAQRLERTYSDLLASPRYGAACRFFLSDIYAAKDFRQRDYEIKHLYAIMSRFLPDFLLGLVKRAIELYDLTNRLDEELLSVLRQDLHVTDTITPELYAEGYRICNNYDQRAYQIELIGQVGHMVETGTKIPLVGTSLKLARIPAQKTGWIELHDFIYRGFHAFRRMHGADVFLQAIHDRETRILDRIFAGDPYPFS